MTLQCPNCGTTVRPSDRFDGRAVAWRLRVRLFGPDDSGELAADSDPDTPAEQLGATVLRGLPVVAEHLGALALGFHAPAVVEGLDEITLEHRLRSLRPTLSRNRGRAVWRVPYKVGGRMWLARVDLEKVETGGEG